MFGLQEMMLSFIRRQVGLRTDDASSNGSLHGKAAYIIGRTPPLPKVLTPSSTLQLSADTSVTCGNTYYELLKRFIVVGVGGVKVGFTCHATGSSTHATFGIFTGSTNFREYGCTGTTYYTPTFQVPLDGNGVTVISIYGKVDAGDAGAASLYGAKVYYDIGNEFNFSSAVLRDS